MNKFIVGIMLVFLLLPGVIWAAQTGDTNNSTNNPSQQQGGPMKPPPEAIAACKGKTEGTSVQFTTPRGDTLKGVCKKFKGVLAAMPEMGGPPPQGNRPDEGNSGQSSK